LALIKKWLGSVEVGLWVGWVWFAVVGSGGAGAILPTLLDRGGFSCSGAGFSEAFSQFSGLWC
jgi:hypothetical protein